MANPKAKEAEGTGTGTEVVERKTRKRRGPKDPNAGLRGKVAGHRCEMTPVLGPDGNFEAMRISMVKQSAVDLTGWGIVVKRSDMRTVRFDDLTSASA